MIIKAFCKNSVVFSQAKNSLSKNCFFNHPCKLLIKNLSMADLTYAVAIMTMSSGVHSRVINQLQNLPKLIINFT